jgi:hypothetical protein
MTGIIAQNHAHMTFENSKSTSEITFIKSYFPLPSSLPFCLVFCLRSFCAWLLNCSVPCCLEIIGV